MEKAVVTGATSMIGVALIEKCIVERVKVYAVVRPGSLNLNRLPCSDLIQIVECDLECLAELERLIHEECDVFYHLSWAHTGQGRNDNLMYQIENIRYTLQAVWTAKALGCKKFIGAGSQAEYGCVDRGMIAPDTPVNPVQAYGIAKYAAGKFAMLECSRMSMVCIWVRIFSVYGENDKKSSMISQSMQKFLNREEPAFTAGEQIWDYLYSSDAGKAMYLIGKMASESKIYCLGKGEGRKLKEYIRIMGEVADSGQELGLGKIPYSSHTIMNLQADISSLKEDTGFKPEVDFRDGIKRVFEALKRETE